MTTSAGTLVRLLSFALHHKNPKDKFGSVIADKLSLEGPNREIDAVLETRSLIIRVHDDIGLLGLPNERAARLRVFMNPFNGLQNLSQSHLDIQTAKNNFLKSDNITGLINIDDALFGNVEYKEFDNSILELASKFRGLRNDLEELKLPDELKKAFSEQLSKMASMIENLNVYSAERIKRELEALVGTVVVNGSAGNGKVYEFYRNICALAVPVFLGLQAVDTTLASGISIAENTNALLEYFQPEEELTSNLNSGDSSEINPESGSDIPQKDTP